jgi:protein SCO1
MRPYRLVLLFLAIGVAAFAAVLWGDQTGNGNAAIQIGGPFQLQDTSGAPVSNETYRGRLMLVTFGYTYCPDVCPTELQTISQAMSKLGPDATEVAPIFISVDPERDLPKRLQDYLSIFGAPIAGLTGTREQIASVAKEYRVFFRKAGDTSSQDYTIDHSAIIYLMDRQGHYLTHFTFETSADTMASALKKYISEAKSS